MKASLAAQKVIQSAGIKLADADDYIIELAEMYLEQHYYIKPATDALIHHLHGPRYR